MYLADEATIPDWKGFEWRSEIVNLKGATALARKFLQVFENHPITRIRISPGQAYIAPTENLVHDGSTETADTADVACHIHAQ
jgi:hypothetical protein